MITNTNDPIASALANNQNQTLEKALLPNNPVNVKHK